MAAAPGAPWRDLPERFGNWSAIYKNFTRWAGQCVWARVLEKVQALAHHRGDLDWGASIDSSGPAADEVFECVHP